MSVTSTCMKVVVADFKADSPWEGDQFIMQVLINLGYPKEMLLWLNWVQVALQLLFMLDILKASGNKINHEILSRCPSEEAWSNIQWPNKQLMDLDFQQLRNAIIFFSPSLREKGNVGWCIAPTHRIWRWIPMLWAPVGNNRRHFGHHCCWHASPN